MLQKLLKMELCDLITEVEQGDFSHAEEADFSLVGNIMGELEIAAENPARAKLFGDARQLSDAILEPYLRLDEADKQKMAEVYEREECFQQLGLSWQGIKWKTFKENIGEGNLLLLEQISNYSKLIPVIGNYVDWIRETRIVRPGQLSFYSYMKHHSWEGSYTDKKADSLEKYQNHNFRVGTKNSRLSQQEFQEIILWGLSERLGKEFLDAVNLLPIREKVAKNYINFVASIRNPTPFKISPHKYFSSHDIDGQLVESDSLTSLSRLFGYNFTTQMLRTEDDSLEDFFRGFSVGFGKDIKDGFYKALTLYDKRHEELEMIKQHLIEGGSLTSYRAAHGAGLLEGKFPFAPPIKIADYSSRIKNLGFDFEDRGLVEEVLSLYNRNLDQPPNFENGGLIEDLMLVSEAIQEKFYRLDESRRTILQKVYDKEKYFRTLGGIRQGHRNRILHNNKISMEEFLILQQISNYSKLVPVLERLVARANEYRGNSPSLSQLSSYFSNRDISGDKVERNSSASMRNVYIYDFKNGRKLKEASIKNAFCSLTLGIPADLKQRVWEAITYLPQREQIAENYIAWINSTNDPSIKKTGLNAYFGTHDFKGDSTPLVHHTSLYNWIRYDFENMRSIRSGSSEEEKFKRFTYGFSDDLRQRLKDTLSLKNFRYNFLKNYVVWAENSKSTSIYAYARNHSLQGEYVENGESSCYRFCTQPFRFAPKRKDNTITSLITHLTFDIEDKDLVAKVRQYALPKAA